MCLILSTYALNFLCTPREWSKILCVCVQARDYDFKDTYPLNKFHKRHTKKETKYKINRQKKKMAFVLTKLAIQNIFQCSQNRKHNILL